MLKTEGPNTEADVLDDCFPVPVPTTPTQVELSNTDPATLCRSTRVRTASDRLAYPS